MCRKVAFQYFVRKYNRGLLRTVLQCLPASKARSLSASPSIERLSHLSSSCLVVYVRVRLKVQELFLRPLEYSNPKWRFQTCMNHSWFGSITSGDQDLALSADADSRGDNNTTQQQQNMYLTSLPLCYSVTPLHQTTKTIWATTQHRNYGGYSDPREILPTGWMPPASFPMGSQGSIPSRKPSTLWQSTIPITVVQSKYAVCLSMCLNMNEKRNTRLKLHFPPLSVILSISVTFPT